MYGRTASIKYICGKDMVCKSTRVHTGALLRVLYVTNSNATTTQLCNIRKKRPLPALRGGIFRTQSLFGFGEV